MYVAEVVTFILGFFSGILALLTVAMAKSAPAEKKSRRWTSIQRVQFRWSFDYSFKEPLLLKELVGEMPSLVARNIEQRPLPDDGTAIDPGSYSVELLVSARFVGREPDEQA